MFQLDPRSSKSIYEQVIDNIKMQIMTGVLPQDSRLPSVRELSGQLTVNPNTVQKAYLVCVVARDPDAGSAPAGKTAS